MLLPWAQVLSGVENHLISLKLLQMESKTTALLGYGKFHLCEAGFACFPYFLSFIILKSHHLYTMG